MKLTTTSIMEMTGCKKGTIEEFRRLLRNMGHLKGNRQLTVAQFEVFKESLIETKGSGETLRMTFRKNIERKFKTVEKNIDLLDAIVPFLLYKLNGQCEVIETKKSILHDVGDEAQHFLYDIFIPNLKEINPIVKIEDDEVVMYTIKLEDYSYHLIKVDKSNLHVLCGRDHSYNLHRIEFARQVIVTDDVRGRFAHHAILI